MDREVPSEPEPLSPGPLQPQPKEADFAEVEALAWTHDGKLQQASYKGLLVDADAAEVFALR